MNSLRAEALLLKRKWRRRFVPSSILLLLLLLALQTLRAAPRGERAGSGLPRGGAVQSDSAPPDLQPPAPDLKLAREDERKAEAMAWYADALIAEDNADVDRALEEYQKVLDLDPGFTELALKIASELARRGNAPEGINLLKDAIKAAPKDPLPYLCLSQLYQKYLRKNDAAVKYATQALELDPTNFTSYSTLHELYTAGGHEKEARQILDRAARQENGTPEFWLQFADLLVRPFLKGESASSGDDLKRLDMVCQKALSLAPEDATILARVADYFAVSNQLKEAIALYQKLIKLKHDSNDPVLLGIRDKLARSYCANGQNDEAIALLGQMIKENPLRSENYELLGKIYEEKEDFPNALAIYQQTLLLDPNLPLNHLRTADMLLKTKQFDKAVALLDEARGKFPEMPQITYSLAVARSQAKQYPEALSTFEEALHEAEYSQPAMLNSAFYFAYGGTAEQAGDIAKAVTLLRKSINLDPADAAQPCNYLGYLWIDRGENLEEAGALIRRALELQPDNPAFLDSLGWYYFKKGEFEKAQTELQKAASLLKPEDAVVFDHLGDTCSKLNKPAEALLYWQKAAKLDPDNKSYIAKIDASKQNTATNPAPAK